MARKHSLSDFFCLSISAERRSLGLPYEYHPGNYRVVRNAVIAAVTGRHSVAVLAMFRSWYPSLWHHIAMKRLALSNPRPLTRGQIDPNVTKVRKSLEDLTVKAWQPRPSPAAYGTGITIPPMPGSRQ